MLLKNLPLRTASSVLTALAATTALPLPAAHAAEGSPVGRSDTAAAGVTTTPAAGPGPALADTGADGSARVLVGASVVLMTAGASLLVIRRHRAAGRRAGG
ncbi:hypothetical protein [Kitasatospora sp. NPDC057223]|uniref:hypothetical protein n=1 Tax=Kitasatospora sp. NPDC057223 TaxID=3346055 RepID=UPI003645675E